MTNTATALYFGIPGQQEEIPHPRGGVQSTRERPTNVFKTGTGGARVSRSIEGKRQYTLNWQQLWYETYAAIEAYHHGHKGPGPFALHDPGRTNWLTVNQSSATSHRRDADGFSISPSGSNLSSAVTAYLRGPRSLEWGFDPWLVLYDNYGRTVTGGWGTADSGQAWSVAAGSTAMPTLGHVAVGAVSAADNAAVSPAMPAGTQDGDLLIAVARIRTPSTSYSSVLTISAGWAPLIQAGQIWAWYLYRGTAAVPPPTITPTSGASGDTVQAYVTAWRGLTVDIETSASITNAASASTIAYAALDAHTTPGITILLAGRDDDATSMTVAGGFTEIIDSATTTGSDQHVYAAYQITTTGAGTSAGNITITGGTSAVSGAVVLALRQAVQGHVDGSYGRIRVPTQGGTIGEQVTTTPASGPWAAGEAWMNFSIAASAVAGAALTHKLAWPGPSGIGPVEASLAWNVDGSLTAGLSTSAASSTATLPFTHSGSDTWVSMHALHDASTMYVRFWEMGTTEPSTWSLQVNFVAGAVATVSTVTATAVRNASNTNSMVELLFDDLLVYDNAATAPSGVLVLDAPSDIWPGIPVVQGVAMNFSFYVKTAPGTTLLVAPQLRWLDANGTVLSTTTGTTIAATSSSWQQATVTASPPASACYVTCRATPVGTVTVGTVAYLDEFQLERGSAATAWRPGTGVMPVSVVSMQEQWPWTASDYRQNATLVLQETGP